MCEYDGFKKLAAAIIKSAVDAVELDRRMPPSPPSHFTQREKANYKVRRDFAAMDGANAREFLTEDSIWHQWLNVSPEVTKRVAY